MTENTIFYDSQMYKYQPLIKVKTMSMSKTSRSNVGVIKEKTFTPLRVIAYDHQECVQVDVIFDNTNNAQIEEYNLMETELDNANLSGLYPDKWIWPLIEVAPHGNFPQNNMELYNVNNIIRTSDEKELLISFCAASKDVTIQIKDEESTGFTYLNLDKIVEYEVLTNEEKTFIKQYAIDINECDYKQVKKSKNFFSNIFGNKKNDNGALSSSALINSLHLTEQEKQIFDPEMITVSAGATNSEEALSQLVGLENVKTEIKKLKSKLTYRNKQKERGIFIGDSSSMHMCFTGSPGTGKTTVARIIAGVLYDMGYIKENRCIEVNGQNLKGGYQGQTAIITKLVMKSAKNKVLFIDEAYALFDNYQSGYGKEAVAVILKHMEDERDNTVVIFAGYKDDMEEFLTMNDGLKSRINRYIDFKNYSTKELTDILILLLKKKKLYITEEALGKCVLAFKKAASTERFSNARFVRNLIEKIEYEHAYNTHGTKDIRRQDTITIEDIPDEIVDELLTHSM